MIGSKFNNILSDSFVKQMEKELQENQIKGNWEDWKPTKQEWLWEIQYHMAKLQIAIQNNEKENIKEYSADVANLAEKSYTQFGLS